MNPTLDTHEEQTSSVTAEEAVREEEVQSDKVKNKKNEASTDSSSKKHEVRGLGRWDNLTSWVREKTPAGIINNGSRINFGLKAVADSMGIASSLGWRLTKNSKAGAVKSWPRFVANVITSATLVPGVIYKEQPVSEEQIEGYKSLSTFDYVKLKIHQAFNPKDHVVETVALATVLNGAFTVFAGFQQSNFRGFHAASFKSWKSISMEVWQGAFTVVAGMLLGLVPKRERAWQLSTAAFTWRIPIKGSQAYTALFKGYPNASPPVPAGDPFQMINFALQQVANIFGFFYAGIKKTEDGDIIHLGKDEEKVDLEKEQIRGYNFKPNKKLDAQNASVANGSLETTPSTVVNGGIVAHHAMPERVEAKKHEMTEATV